MPAAFQVLLQLRALWTGVMFWFLMGRKLSGKQVLGTALALRAMLTCSLLTLTRHARLAMCAVGGLGHSMCRRHLVTNCSFRGRWYMLGSARGNGVCCDLTRSGCLNPADPMGDKRSSLAFQALLMTIMYTLASVGAGEALEHRYIATVLSRHLPPC